MFMPAATAFIKRWIFILVYGLLAGLPMSGYAQLCAGSLGDPVVKIDFGAGTAVHAGALPNGTTSYSYSGADFPNDGSYTVENTTAGSGNVWWSTTDHTGNSGGYMMVVNASSSKTDYFYKTTVTGLCAGTTFEFAAWAANLIRTQDVSPPDLTFTILKTDGVTKLATINTGTIPITPAGLTWKQYGTYFTMPAGVSDVIVQITNNSPGGIPGNDLVLDDITFRPCGPVITSNFVVNNVASTSQVVCGSGPQNVNLNANVAAGSYTNPVYQWQVNTGSGWVNIAGATATTYSFVMQAPAKGTYQYRMVSSEAVNSGSAACQVASNILTLTVPDTPTASFVVSNSNANCLNSAVIFTDTSVQGITKWLWDFGDGQTSATQNPTHAYAVFGDYDVKLTVYNAAGCSSTTTQRIHVTSRLAADFDVTTPGCVNSVITITDHSSTADGTIAKWLWTFGDGSPGLTLTTNAPITHTYATAGTFAVSLEVISATNCVSDITTKQVVILPLPTVDFILPDFCISDSFAKFTDATTMAGGTAGLTYLWDFGDAAASTALNPNTSTAQNPTHKYSSVGNYTVTLKVAAQNGCTSAVASKVFTVNGAIPTAGFTVGTDLCSSNPITFVNTSTVDFGNITKIEIYYDYDNYPTEKTTYLRSQGQIPADNKFYHTYGLFIDPPVRNVHVRMIAYSGESCISLPFDKTITVYANPSVSLTAIGPFCTDAAPVQIIENKNGFTGTGVFSGPGVSSTGLFNPATAGAGTFTIQYLFTSQAGCTYTDSLKVTVNAVPAVTMATTATVLEGGQVTFNPKVTGGTLTYKWTPTIGVSDPTILNPLLSPSANTTYTLTVTSAQGCSAAAQIVVSVLKTPVVPNTFTPNNDGYNDTWDIKYLDTYLNATVNVFNRYGEKVYSSIGYSIPWDGKFKGVALPFGVYYYIIDPKSGRKPMSGSLTIIK